jgi:hypothetical protein
MVGGFLRVLSSSTTKTGRHDIAEILLKVVLNTKKPPINQSINQSISSQNPCVPFQTNAYNTKQYNF